jgi:hypothetical protein
VRTPFAPGCAQWNNDSRCLVMPPGTTFHLVTVADGNGTTFGAFNIGGTSPNRPSLATNGFAAPRARAFVRGYDGYLWSRGYKQPGQPASYGPDNCAPWLRHNAVQLSGGPSCQWMPNTTREFWCAERRSNGQVRVLRWVATSLNPIAE